MVPLMLHPSSCVEFHAVLIGGSLIIRLFNVFVYLHFLQATAVACGAYHTAALMIPREQEGASTSNAIRHTLYTFGRGE